MPTYHDWLHRILTQGESVQDAPPPTTSESPDAEALLASEFAAHALDVAGPPLTFDPVAGCAAALLLAKACWALANGSEDNERITLSLNAPSTPAAHLSVDLTFRFLPSVLRRARFREPDGELARQIEALLRAWPLSGILADLDGSPATDPGFGGHPGLQMLYAERLAATGRPGWVPVSSSAREWAERVHQELGKPLPALLPEEPHD